MWLARVLGPLFPHLWFSCCLLGLQGRITTLLEVLKDARGPYGPEGLFATTPLPAPQGCLALAHLLPCCQAPRTPGAWVIQGGLCIVRLADQQPVCQVHPWLPFAKHASPAWGSEPQHFGGPLFGQQLPVSRSSLRTTLLA